MELRKVGLALLVFGAFVWLGAGLVSPFPTSALSLESKTRDAGTLDGSRVMLAAGVAYVHGYDEVNDTTYFRVAMCSHTLCGPVVGVKGDLRAAGLHAPLLLRPVDDSLSFIPPPAADAPPTYFQTRNATEAYSSLFEPRSPWPVFLPRLFALGFAAVGIALVARPRFPALLPGLLGSLVGLPVARGPSFIILSQIALIPLAIAALIALAIELPRRRSAWIAGGIALFLVVELAASLLAFTHFVPDGGD